MAGQDAGATVEGDDAVLHVDVEDPIGEPANELDRIDALPEQVAGVEIEAELLPIVQRFQGSLGRVEVEGDFRGVDLQGELHPAFAEHVQDGVEPLGQQLEAVLDRLGRDGRERVEQVPDAGAGETVDDAHAEFLRRPGRVLQFLDRPLVDAGRIAVAPHGRRQDRLVPLVDQVQHGLAHQVVADGEDLHVVLFQHFPLVGTIVVVGQGLVDLEVVAPAGQLQPVVAELAELLGQGFQGQVGPLAGEHGDRSSHRVLLLRSCAWESRANGRNHLRARLPGEQTKHFPNIRKRVQHPPAPGVKRCGLRKVSA